MRWTFFWALLVIPFVFCSCKTGVTVSGDPCYALTENEINELVAIAQASLRKPQRQLTAADTRTICTQKPAIIVNYTGDCCGEVKIRWKLPDKQATVRFRGLLNDHRRRICSFEIVPDGDRVVYKGVPGKKDTVQ